MASAKGIRAGKAFVEIFADDSKLSRGLTKISAKLKAWGAGITAAGTKLAGLGAVMIAPLLASAKVCASMGDKLVDMSERTGMSIEALSELGYVAQQTGLDLDGLEGGIRKMQKFVVEAAKGSQSAQDALQQLGLSVQDLDGLSPEAMLKKFADSLSQIKDPTIKAAAAMEVFGKSGAAFVPLLQNGSAGIENLQKQARALGLTISTKDAKAADEFNDSLETLWMVVKRGVFEIGSALTPTLKEVAGWITNAVVTTTAFIRSNKDLIVWIFKIIAGVIAAGVALMVLGKAIAAVGFAITALKVTLNVTSTILSTAFSILAAIISPIGLIISAVALLGGYFLYTSGAINEAAQWLSDGFTTLKDDAIAAFGGISDALAAGDIALAAKVLWLFLKMEWTRGTNWISYIWNSALLWLKQRATEVFYGLVIGLAYIWHGLEVAWIETTAFLSSVWTNFCAGIHHAWLWVVKSLQETWNKIKGLFDEDFNADAANAAIEQQYQQARDEVWNKAKAELSARENQRQFERERSTEQLEGTVQELVKEGEAAKARQQAEFDQKMAQNQSELDAAKKEFDAARKQAHEAKVKADRDKKDFKFKSPDQIAAELGGLSDLNKQIKYSVAGTFNASAAWGLGAGNAQDRTATATEKTAENTRKLLQKIADQAALGYV